MILSAQIESNFKVQIFRSFCPKGFILLYYVVDLDLKLPSDVRPLSQGTSLWKNHGNHVTVYVSLLLTGIQKFTKKLPSSSTVYVHDEKSLRRKGTHQNRNHKNEILGFQFSMLCSSYQLKMTLFFFKEMSLQNNTGFWNFFCF